MIMIHTASMITSRPLYAKLGYDVVRDLSPVTQIVRIPNVLVVPPALPVKNIREFLTLAKRRPGELVFASTDSARYRTSSANSSSRSPAFAASTCPTAARHPQPRR